MRKLIKTWKKSIVMSSKISRRFLKKGKIPSCCGREGEKKWEIISNEALKGTKSFAKKDSLIIWKRYSNTAWNELGCLVSQIRGKFNYWACLWWGQVECATAWPNYWLKKFLKSEKKEMTLFDENCQWQFVISDPMICSKTSYANFPTSWISKFYLLFIEKVLFVVKDFPSFKFFTILPTLKNIYLSESLNICVFFFSFWIFL